VASKTTEETIRYWQQHVEAFEASGLTRVAYSKKNRMQPHQLDYWRKKIARIRKTPGTIAATSWVPVEIREEAAEKGSPIDLWLGRIRIEIKPGFDSRLLVELLRTIGAVC
jgi:hypothetical protein